MLCSIVVLTLTCACFHLVQAGSFNGPVFPVPTQFDADFNFSTTTASLEDLLTESLKRGLPNAGGALNSTSFSLALFSGTRDGPFWQYHYTDPTVRNSTHGTQNVDGDSVFRLGSISKLLATYLLLLVGGERKLNDPVTLYLPELAQGNSSAFWEHVTVGDLPSHLSGIGRDIALNDFAFPWTNESQRTYGFPPLIEVQSPICDYITESFEYKSCTSSELLRAIADQPRLFATGWTPAYSNVAFGLLGLIIERWTCEPFHIAMRRFMLSPLQIKNTYARVAPVNERAVIPTDNTDDTDKFLAAWNHDLATEIPAAGMYSSTNDLAEIGRSILEGSLLPRPVINRWLKPRSFTARANESVGLAWEIYRWPINGRLQDVYTKDGNWGTWAGIMILLPDYNVGVVALTAAKLKAQNALDAFTAWTKDLIVPALHQLAKAEAIKNFCGQYVSEDGTSSMTITSDARDGLKVSSFVTAGVDVIAAMLKGAQILDLKDVDCRLYPNGLDTPNTTIGFTWSNNWVTGDDEYPTWTSVGAPTYGGVSMDGFIFHMDPQTGKAKSIEALAWRLEMQRNH